MLFINYFYFMIFIFIFFQKRNFTLAFEAGESVGIAASLVSEHVSFLLFQSRQFIVFIIIII